MTENQYIELKQLTKTLINISISKGAELRTEDIHPYIKQAIVFSKLECDDELV